MATKRTKKATTVVESMSIKFENTAVRFAKARARIVAWGLDDAQLLKLIEKSEGVIGDVVKRLKAVPSDWVPAKGTTGGVVFPPGAKVQLSDKHAHRYEKHDLTQESELEVQENEGSRIVFKDPKGIQWNVPRSHVQRIAA